MAEENGLIFAFTLDGAGGGRALDWSGVQAWRPEHGVLWMHVDRTHPGAVAWLKEHSGLDPLVVEALTAEDSRPRVTPTDHALMVNLRGVNLNPGADPEDMVSMRLWLEPQRIISCRNRKVLAIDDLRRDLAQGAGPVDPGDLLARLAGRLVDRMTPVIADVSDSVDALEEALDESVKEDFRTNLSDVRRLVIALFRYVNPQREVLRRLYAEPVAWLTDNHRLHLHESADQTTRLVEELTAARERTLVVHDEFQSILSHRLNKTMFMLTLVATVLLPLSVFTGLLGINVGGIPGAQNPAAFGIVVAILAALAGLEVFILRRLKWF